MEVKWLSASWDLANKYGTHRCLPRNILYNKLTWCACMCVLGRNVTKSWLFWVLFTIPLRLNIIETEWKMKLWWWWLLKYTSFSIWWIEIRKTNIIAYNILNIRWWSSSSNIQNIGQLTDIYMDMLLEMYSYLIHTIRTYIIIKKEYNVEIIYIWFVYNRPYKVTNIIISIYPLKYTS